MHVPRYIGAGSMRQFGTEGSKETKSISVMLVEDNELFRKNISGLISRSVGVVGIGSFGTCEDAVDAIKSGVRPDVVLMDIGLPGMNGIDGVRAIKEMHSDVDLIILTVYEDNSKIFDAICAGASGYVLKHSPTVEIVRAIEEVHRGGVSMNASIARRVLDMFKERIAPKEDYGLTEREVEILNMMVGGLTKKRIAEDLCLSYHTVDTHIKNIYSKLHVHSRTTAVAKALRENLI